VGLVNNEKRKDLFIHYRVFSLSDGDKYCKLGLKNERKGSEKYLSYFYFHIFLSDENGNGNARNRNELTYSVSRKQTKLVGIITKTVGNW
jgi:hypothetical protein